MTLKKYSSSNKYQFILILVKTSDGKELIGEFRHDFTDPIEQITVVVMAVGFILTCCQYFGLMIIYHRQEIASKSDLETNKPVGPMAKLMKSSKFGNDNSPSVANVNVNGNGKRANPPPPLQIPNKQQPVQQHQQSQVQHQPQHIQQQQQAQHLQPAYPVVQRRVLDESAPSLYVLAQSEQPSQSQQPMVVQRSESSTGIAKISRENIHALAVEPQVEPRVASVLPVANPSRSSSHDRLSNFGSKENVGLNKSRSDLRQALAAEKLNRNLQRSSSMNLLQEKSKVDNRMSRSSSLQQLSNGKLADASGIRESATFYADLASLANDSADTSNDAKLKELSSIKRAQNQNKELNRSSSMVSALASSSAYASEESLKEEDQQQQNAFENSDNQKDQQDSDKDDENVAVYEKTYLSVEEAEKEQELQFHLQFNETSSKPSSQVALNKEKDKDRARDFKKSSLPRPVIAYPAFAEFDLESKVVLSRKITEGGFGELWDGTFNVEGQRQYNATKCAVKFFKPPRKDEKDFKKALDNQVNSFMNEVSIMYTLQKQKNFIKFFGCTRSPQMSIVTALYRGNLFEFLYGNLPKGSSKVELLPIKIVASIANDILNAVHAMHAYQLAHLDIKTPNFLIDDASVSECGANFKVVLCDFGLTRLLDTKKDLIKGRKKNLTNGISYQYASPEAFAIFENHKYKDYVLRDVFKKVDVYAVATVLNECLTRQFPWGSGSYAEVQQNVMRQQRPGFLEKNPYDEASAPLFELFSQLIQQGWDQNWANRPSTGDMRRSLRGYLGIGSQAKQGR